MAQGNGMKHHSARLVPHGLWSLLLLLALLAGCNQHEAVLGEETLKVTLADQRFDLELALDPPARYQGLSDRTHLADRGGMIFVFPEPAVRRFVMRRCFVPIDLIYLSSTGRIVQTHAMQVEAIDWDNEAWSERDLKHYSSVWPAQFAIEIQGGLIEQLGIEVGQQVDLPTEALIARAK